MWALRQASSFDKLFLKGFKICFIFFLVTHFPHLCNLVLKSFFQIAGTVGATKNLTHIIFNPALLWQYGYDPGVNLLKMATESSGIGLPFLELVLGFGILFTFALLIIQIIVQILSFYFISFAAIIALPFGVFTFGSDMLNQALTNVLKAGVRVMVVIIITGIAANIWNLYGIVKITPESNLNPILGLLFSGLLFLSLLRYLPKITASTIGNLFIQQPSAAKSPDINVSAINKTNTASDPYHTSIASTNGANNTQTANVATRTTASMSAIDIKNSSLNSRTSSPHITVKTLDSQLAKTTKDNHSLTLEKHWPLKSKEEIELIKTALFETFIKQMHSQKTEKSLNKKTDTENWRTPHDTDDPTIK